MFIKNNFKIKTGFYINQISFINFLASFFLGILIALNLKNTNLLLLIFVGFLGCLSTFSSFIYQLFVLLQRRQYILLLSHYFEVLILSIVFFYFGYYVIQIL